MRSFTMLVALLVVVGVAPIARAQTTDERLWLAAEVDAGLGSKVEIAAEQQLRLGNDVGFDETHTELGLSFAATKWLRLGALYRIAFLDDETRHRGGLEGEAGVKLGKARLRYRLRLQATTREASETQWLLRNRLKLDVAATKRIKPFIAAELHHQQSPVAEFRELRFVAGVEYAIAKRIDVSAAYMYQEERNVSIPEENHVLILGFGYHLGNLAATEGGSRGE